jgi:predicted small metal-binding protein
MKKIAIALTTILAFGLFVMACNFENNYTRKDCEVVEINVNIITVEDGCGYLWDFEGEGYELGQRVDLKMHTNHTANSIADDYIKEVK